MAISHVANLQRACLHQEPELQCNSQSVHVPTQAVYGHTAAPHNQACPLRLLCCLQASTKQLLLDTLGSSCSNIHKPGNISALWTPASRVWAAMQACTSGGSALQNSYLGLAGGAAPGGGSTMTTMLV